MKPLGSHHSPLLKIGTCSQTRLSWIYRAPSPVLHELNVATSCLPKRAQPYCLEHKHLIIAGTSQRFCFLNSSPGTRTKVQLTGTIVYTPQELACLTIGRRMHVSRMKIHDGPWVRNKRCLVPGAPGIIWRSTFKTIFGGYELVSDDDQDSYTSAYDSSSGPDNSLKLDIQILWASAPSRDSTATVRGPISSMLRRFIPFGSATSPHVDGGFAEGFVYTNVVHQTTFTVKMSERGPRL